MWQPDNGDLNATGSQWQGKPQQMGAWPPGMAPVGPRGAPMQVPIASFGPAQPFNPAGMPPGGPRGQPWNHPFPQQRQPQAQWNGMPMQVPWNAMGGQVPYGMEMQQPPQQAQKKMMPMKMPPQQQPQPQGAMRYDKLAAPGMQQWGAQQVDQSAPWDVSAVPPQQHQMTNGDYGTSHWGPPPGHMQQQPMMNQQQPQQWGNEWQQPPQRVENPRPMQQQNAAARPMYHYPPFDGSVDQSRDQSRLGYFDANISGQVRIDAFDATTSGQQTQPQQAPQQQQQQQQQRLAEPQSWANQNTNAYPAQAPVAAESNPDIFWHDPNPKNKRAQKDTGTAIWGDPSQQSTEIRRWKDHDEDYRGPTTSWAVPQPTGWGDLPADQWRSTTGNYAAQPAANAAGGWDQSQEERNEIPPNSGPGYPQETMQMTHVIADQLRRVVAKGYLKNEVLVSKMPQEKLILINRLLQRVQRLEQAEEEMEGLQRNVRYGNQSCLAEIDRLSVEIDTLKNEIGALSAQINASVAKSAGGSRLQQWRKGGTDSGVESLIGAVDRMGVDDKVGNWVSAGLSGFNEWSHPPLLADKSSPTPNGNGPQEFIPGKKWEWNDPNRVAEDPNATPGGPTNALFPGQQFSAWSDAHDQHWKNPE